MNPTEDRGLLDAKPKDLLASGKESDAVHPATLKSQQIRDYLKRKNFNEAAARRLEEERLDVDRDTENQGRKQWAKANVARKAAARAEAEARAAAEEGRSVKSLAANEKAWGGWRELRQYKEERTEPFGYGGMGLARRKKVVDFRQRNVDIAKAGGAKRGIKWKESKIADSTRYPPHWTAKYDLYDIKRKQERETTDRQQSQAGEPMHV